MIKAIGIAFIAALTGLTFGLSAVAGASPAAPAKPAAVTRYHCNTPVPSGDTRHVVNSGASLVQWADAHAYGSVGNILSATIQCGPGIQQLSFFKYLDKADLRAPLPAGTVLWVPFGGYERS